MFYCEKCADKNDWPATPFQSYGKCETCGKPGLCNDRPSSLLPDPKPTLKVVQLDDPAPKALPAPVADAVTVSHAEAVTIAIPSIPAEHFMRVIEANVDGPLSDSAFREFIRHTLGSVIYPRTDASVSVSSGPRIGAKVMHRHTLRTGQVSSYDKNGEVIVELCEQDARHAGCTFQRWSPDQVRYI